MLATRYFVGIRAAQKFAREVGSKAEAMEAWNPMREFGYKFQVAYTPKPSLEESR